jgi:hypothetical protein
MWLTQTFNPPALALGAGPWLKGVTPFRHGRVSGMGHIECYIG